MNPEEMTELQHQIVQEICDQISDCLQEIVNKYKSEESEDLIDGLIAYTLLAMSVSLTKYHIQSGFPMFLESVKEIWEKEDSPQDLN